jgi:hypothetical protein
MRIRTHREHDFTVYPIVMAALGIVGGTAVGIVTTASEAQAAGCENGQAESIAVNASKGRCFGH